MLADIDDAAAAAAAAAPTPTTAHQPTPLRIADATEAQLDAAASELARITQAQASAGAATSTSILEALQLNRRELRQAFHAAAVPAAEADATSGASDAHATAVTAADGRLAIARLAIQLHRRSARQLALEDATKVEAENTKLRMRVAALETEQLRRQLGRPESGLPTAQHAELAPETNGSPAVAVPDGAKRADFLKWSRDRRASNASADDKDRRAPAAALAAIDPYLSPIFAARVGPGLGGLAMRFKDDLFGVTTATDSGWTEMPSPPPALFASAAALPLPLPVDPIAATWCAVCNAAFAVGLAELAVGGALGPADVAAQRRSQRAVTGIAALALLDAAFRNASASDPANTGDHALYTGGVFRAASCPAEYSTVLEGLTALTRVVRATGSWRTAGGADRPGVEQAGLLRWRIVELAGGDLVPAKKGAKGPEEVEAIAQMCIDLAIVVYALVPGFAMAMNMAASALDDLCHDQTGAVAVVLAGTCDAIDVASEPPVAPDLTPAYQMPSPPSSASPPSPPSPTVGVVDVPAPVYQTPRPPAPPPAAATTGLGGRFHITTAHGKLIRVEGDRANAVDQGPDTKCVFTFEDQGNGHVALKCYTGKYLCMEDKGRVICNRASLYVNARRCPDTLFLTPRAPPPAPPLASPPCHAMPCQCCYL